MILLHTPPVSTGAYAQYPYSPGLMEALTYESTFDGKQYLARKSLTNMDILMVPRRLAPSRGIDVRVTHAMGAIDCKAPPRNDQQAKVIAESVQLLKQDVDHVLEAPTGFGKTYVGSAIAARMGEATLIAIPKEDLMKSWRDTLIKLIGVPPEAIGIAQADKLDYKGKRFVLAMIHSLVKPGKYDSEFWGYFGLLIVDETHRVGADTFQNVGFLCPAKHRLGLSATPKRNDGKTKTIDAHIGPVMVRATLVPMKPKILVKQTGWYCPDWLKDSDEDGEKSLGNVGPDKMAMIAKAMSKSEKRNEHIVKFISSCYKQGRNVVAMGDSIEHLKTLFMACGKVGIPGDQMGFYTGELSKKPEQLKANAMRRVVFATYGMCGEGTDYPHWDALVMVTPRANVKQPVGRILRIKEDKKQPVVLDLVDGDKLFQGYHFKRQKQYFEVGGTMVKV